MVHLVVNTFCCASSSEKEGSEGLGQAMIVTAQHRYVLQAGNFRGMDVNQ